MEIQTRRAIDGLRGDIGRVETILRAEIGKLRGEVTALRDEVASVRSDVMRHTDIRFESLRDDIRLIADGFAFLSAKIDTIAPRSS